MEAEDHQALQDAQRSRQRRQQRRRKCWQGAVQLWEKTAAAHRRCNTRLDGKWSDGRFTAVCLAVLVLLAAWMLWRPGCLGLGNDGTIQRVLQNAGLSYLEADKENGSDYFTRLYQTAPASPEDRSAQLGILSLARWVDDLVTKDSLFDVRFLSAVYVLLALPGWALLIRGLLGQVTGFLEKCVVSAACVLVLGDVSYLTYFNSLYPEALYLIGLAYLLGAAGMLGRESRWRPLWYFPLLAGTVLLCLTRRHCWVVGLLAAGFCVSQLRLSRDFLCRLGIGLTAAGMLAAGFYSLGFVENDFDDTSRIHAMTRGVLLQSDDPEKTLSSFGIDGSYAMLTDVSLYDSFPLTEESEYFLQNGFLDRYDTLDLAQYYLRHPGAMVSMLDIGTKSAGNLRREFCGNYQRTAGMPPKGKSIFFSAYSIFRARSMPHTLAYPLLLLILCGVLSYKGWWRKKEPGQAEFVFFWTALLAAAILFVHLAEGILCSGDAQLVQYNLLAGFCMDDLGLLTLSALLRRLNILEEKKK